MVGKTFRQPVEVGQRYTDCTDRVAVARDVVPVTFARRQTLWYWLTGRAPNWDVVGDYVEPLREGDFSNASWRHCGCELIDADDKA